MPKSRRERNLGAGGEGPAGAEKPREAPLSRVAAALEWMFRGVALRVERAAAHMGGHIADHGCGRHDQRGEEERQERDDEDHGCHAGETGNERAIAPIVSLRTFRGRAPVAARRAFRLRAGRRMFVP